MADLTKEERDALSDGDFAVPGKRLLPMPDGRHARLAWDMVDRTGGLTPGERREARRRILRRAAELGVDTTGWMIHGEGSVRRAAAIPEREALAGGSGAEAGSRFTLEAMAIEMPFVPGHPNRVPFSGVLTRVDRASDHPPGGAGGKCVLIPRAVAEAALPSLLGMGVDCTLGLDGHDRKAKIGIITGAVIVEDKPPQALEDNPPRGLGGAIGIEGFFYGNDFPEIVARIRREKNSLGFSYEVEEVTVRDWSEDPLVIESMIFTGAAVLYKADAAYTSTSLAAKADEPSAAEKEKQGMEELLKKMGEQMAALTASVENVGKRVEAVEKIAVQAGAMHEKVKPHVEALRACADRMEAAGIGTHPTEGHVNVLRHMAARMEAEAIMGNLPHIYRDHDFIGKTMEAGARGENPETKKLIEGLQAQVADANTKLADLQAKAFSASGAPERKTVTPEVAALLKKHGLNAEGKDALSVEQIDRTLEAAGIKGRVAIETKLKLMSAGVLPVGQAG